MKKSYIAAAIATLVLIVWLASGHWFGADSAAAPSQPQSPDAALQTRPMRVAVETIERQDVVREVVVQGHAEPWRSLRLRVETAGRIESLPVEKGGRVRPGTLIARLAVEDRAFRVEQARARVQQLQAELDAALSLERSGLQARLRVEQAEADLAAARAELERTRLELANIELKAPFAGVINERDAELGDYLDRAAVVATLVDNSRLRLRGDVPQQSVAGLALGQQGEVRFITGATASGRLIYISAEADPATRSYRIELEVDNAEARLRAGMSAEIRIPVETIAAHFMSPALLSLGEKGELGVKTVTDENRVHLHPVRIVRTGTDGIWVSGLPPQARVITQGQGFVRHGDQVEPVPAKSS